MNRVLIDMHRLKHNPYNGLYVFSKELGQALAAAELPGMQLHFYVPPKDKGVFGPKVAYENHHSRDKIFKFGTGQFDVWHITTTISWYRPFSKKVKVVYTIHDLNFLLEDRDKPKRNDRVLKLIRQRADRADCIVGISQYALDAARQHLPISNKQQRVIYNGASTLLPHQTTKPGYVPAAPFLFSVGQMYRRKNFHVLPPLLVGNNYELVIAGLHQTDYGNEVLRVAGEHGVQDRVRLLGPVSEEEKHWYYQYCLAFMFPSLAEGFGLPVIEAMHYGKPVFLSRETCLPEIGGAEAYYFNGFDAAGMQQDFAAGLAHYNEVNPSEKIKERARFFSWQKAAAEYIHLYQELCSG